MTDAVTLADKVAFLSRPDAYPGHPAVSVRETHMSWVFLAGDTVYKLKKPVRFSYLDFSTRDKREAACREELAINRRLAPSVYREVVPLCVGPGGLALGGEGTVADWLVVMRRLDESLTLESCILDERVARAPLDRLCGLLIRFYRRAHRPRLSVESFLANWRRHLAENRQVLFAAPFGLPLGQLVRIDRVQSRFLAERTDLLLERFRAGKIVDGHGDLRPEHVWLGNPPEVIDRLEFNRHLRVVDPFDEIAYLSVECERLGAAWVGEMIARRLLRALGDGTLAEGRAQALFCFYRCYRATLRARLAMAHMLEPDVRTPEKWPHLTRTYLGIAEREAIRLERELRRRKGRPRCGPDEGV